MAFIIMSITISTYFTSLQGSLRGALGELPRDPSVAVQVPVLRLGRRLRLAHRRLRLAARLPDQRLLQSGLGFALLSWRDFWQFLGSLFTRICDVSRLIEVPSHFARINEQKEDVLARFRISYLIRCAKYELTTGTKSSTKLVWSPSMPLPKVF